jgi:hypothetical protein
MTTVRMLYHLARADFLERVRRYSFLVTLAATAYLGYLLVPPLDAQYQTVTLGNARGVYNSPWIGAMFGLMITTMVSLIAFYLINNAIQRDRQTRVGEIIASTPVSKTLYALGKWLSNVAVLALMMAVLTLAAVGMQLFRAEDLHIDLWALVAPIWLMGLPVMATVAAVAVLFESIPFLSGGFGNIVYFFSWIMILTMILLAMEDSASGMISNCNDLYGISRTIADMQRAIKTYDPDYSGSFSIGADAVFDDPLVFPWEGITWTPALVWERLGWLLLAPVIAILAALPFDRFDPARRRAPRTRRRRHARRKRRRDDVEGNDSPEFPSSRPAAPVIPTTSLTPFPNRRAHWRFIAVLRAELRLMLRGQPWWWYLVAAGLIISSAVTPPDAAVILLAFAWLWPILIWSPMGAREARHFTHELVFSVPHPLRRQLAATWLSGVAVALLMTSGALIRAISAGDDARVAAMLAGVSFVPSLALALGVWSRSSRLFEVVYLMLWYVAFNGVPTFDFMGLGNTGAQQGYSLVYLALALILFVVSAIGRRSQLQQ